MLHAEAAVPRRGRQIGELRVAHMHQSRVIAALEKHLGLLLDAVVDDQVEAIALADGGDGAAHAVLEQIFDLAFAGEIDVVAKLPSELGEADVVCLLPPDELLALHDALDRLAELDPEAAELIKVRCFAGLSVEEAGGALGMSRTSAYRHWTYARAWLFSQLRGEAAEPEA